MAWTTPKTWTNEPLVAGDLNTHLRDNLTELKDPPSDSYILDESSDYSTASTAFVDIDSTNLSFNITTNGGNIWVIFCPSIACTGLGAMDIDVDGVRQGGDDGIIAWNSTPTKPGRVIPLIYRVEGLSAGSHTFKIQWKSFSGSQFLYAGAGTTDADIHPQVIIQEIS